ncbi:MAG TPA: stage V sporulation protein AE [Candidatus Butyricicoccus stercorigallinarum]|nr:stage V sporulation protein AE [Candidatus Butyricicoccus stercorigallinarum]
MPYVTAFVVGGVICALSQILIDRTRLTPARILTAYVVLGVVLTAVGVYQPLVDFAGAGATVPLLGFGYVLAEGVRTAVAESGLLGALTGGVKAAAGGISAAVVCGLLAALLFRPADKS